MNRKTGKCIRDSIDELRALILQERSLFTQGKRLRSIVVKCCGRCMGMRQRRWRSWYRLWRQILRRWTFSEGVAQETVARPCSDVCDEGSAFPEGSMRRLFSIFLFAYRYLRQETQNIYIKFGWSTATERLEYRIACCYGTWSQGEEDNRQAERAQRIDFPDNGICSAVRRRRVGKSDLETIVFDRVDGEPQMKFFKSETAGWHQHSLENHSDKAANEITTACGAIYGAGCLQLKLWILSFDRYYLVFDFLEALLYRCVYPGSIAWTPLLSLSNEIWSSIFAGWGYSRAKTAVCYGNTVLVVGGMFGTCCSDTSRCLERAVWLPRLTWSFWWARFVMSLSGKQLDGFVEHDLHYKQWRAAPGQLLS